MSLSPPKELTKDELEEIEEHLRGERLEERIKEICTIWNLNESHFGVFHLLMSEGHTVKDKEVRKRFRELRQQHNAIYELICNKQEEIQEANEDLVRASAQLTDYIVILVKAKGVMPSLVNYEKTILDINTNISTLEKELSELQDEHANIYEKIVFFHTTEQLKELEVD